MNNLTTEQLREHILQELNKINISQINNYYFEKNNAGGREGTYVYSDSQGYHYVYSEKGNESKHKITDNVFDVSFWVIDSVISSLAIDYMRKNIQPGENQRKVIFAKELELLKEIGENYYKAGEIEIDEILKENPL